MNRPLWIIATIGVIGVFFMVIMMISVLEMKVTRYSGLADEIRLKFQFDDVRISVTDKSLKIIYYTSKFMHYDAKACDEEMETVFNFVSDLIKRDEKSTFTIIDIARDETSGSGCFRTTYTREYSKPVQKS